LRKLFRTWIIVLASLLLFFFNTLIVYAEKEEIILADFEISIPSSDDGDPIGFRERDRVRSEIVNDGAEGTKQSAAFKVKSSQNRSSAENDFFFQGKVRRMYLATRSRSYQENAPNALSFWIKLQPESSLLAKNRRNTFGVWTYHWRPGDPYVGGKSNNQLATDSMMHGYSNFFFNEGAAGRWVQVVLSPSAFQQSRYYYHHYAARSTTDDLKFFSSLRQIQFHFFPRIVIEEKIQIDELKLVYLEPAAIFEKDFFKVTASINEDNIEVPVTIRNVSDKNRRYRVFISSFIGVQKKELYKAHTSTDSFKAPRLMQNTTGGDGGTGVVELVDSHGDSVIKLKKEIIIPAGGRWRGKLVHYLRPEMIGPTKFVRTERHVFEARRNTLTTSVIVWDPYHATRNDMTYVEVLPSNADDGKHPPPPGFPEQKRPPEGWRSEDIPMNQVGGYFVSIIQLTD
jgi:hypothetical protein